MSSQSDQGDSRPTATGILSGIDLTGKTCVITGASSGLRREFRAEIVYKSERSAAAWPGA